uniref:Uncharacterized protein n=1 Tax=Oryza meridionalis TaxID=40149 RepID=A0A0E0CJF4_9ORYZ
MELGSNAWHGRDLHPRRVVSLVERLGRAQGMEAALATAMEAGHRRLLLQRETTEVAELKERIFHKYLVLAKKMTNS